MKLYKLCLIYWNFEIYKKYFGNEIMFFVMIWFYRIDVWLWFCDIVSFDFEVVVSYIYEVYNL